MMTIDTCCTLVPYFKIHPGQMGAFKSGCDAFVEKTRLEVHAPAAELEKLRESLAG